MTRLLPDGRPLAPLIDHTLLKPDTRRDQVEKLCDEALECGFAAVCVLPVWLAVVTERHRRRFPARRECPRNQGA